MRDVDLDPGYRAGSEVMEDGPDGRAAGVNGNHVPARCHDAYSGAGVGYGTDVLPSACSRVGTMVSSGMCARRGSCSSIRHASATSSGRSIASASSTGGGDGRLSKSAVLTRPGLMTENLTQFMCSSKPAVAARAFMPALLAAYAGPLRSGHCPETLPIKTTSPRASRSLP